MNSCGSCTLCCQIVPVAEIGLKSFTRCQHERNLPFATTGCAIYDHRPRSCRLWSCQWLSEDWEQDLRPDRCGVVVDELPDLVRLGGVEMPAIQMWVAAGFEDAYQRQPALALILAALDRGAVIWRYRAAGGGQTGRLLYREEKTGRLIVSEEVAPDEKYSAEIPVGERMVRAIRLAEGRR